MASSTGRPPAASPTRPPGPSADGGAAAPGRAWRTPVLVVGALLAATVVGGGLLADRAGVAPWVDPQDVNRFAHDAPWVDPGSTAATWLATAPAGDPVGVLATTASGIWITPEAQPPGAVGDHVRSLVQQAGAAGQVPLLVVYGIPQRDCGAGLSGGGLPAADYPGWVRELAAGARAERRTVVVLEPDALAGAAECGLVEQRVQLLADAVDVLAAAGVTTYVDAGHSGWTPPEEMADLLERVGVAQVRGFATNVSNFQTTADEQVYAAALRRSLPGSHHVIDTGRNGAGATSDWCNPPGRALGVRPAPVDDDHLDALLWIKPPGESDGACGGGPAAGTFWPQRAAELVAAGPVG